MAKLFLCMLLAVPSFVGPVSKAHAQITTNLAKPKNDAVQERSSCGRKASLADSVESIVVCSPLRTPKITSHFGMRRHPVTGKNSFHNGVDLKSNNPVVMAIYNGIVVQAGEHPFLGRFICIDHGGVHSIYGHLSACVVVVGDEVRAGQEIAYTGRTGRATGVHLHFSIRIGTHYIDPLMFLLVLQKQFLNK
ncbi:M23 family metallopeptidase [Sphingobacterium bambusae]|uniref:M23 family metallopeptidase n=1 Tax=Sphingobacterium bambusae TaxID=662858 RepID=A0ABW6BA40_9SPHI|nr:M23 family metallopeptidase [Sphingobacterium bambusae]WPL48534.1 M23 family metallopeptidase [Sphingobacterium bambusae]